MSASEAPRKTILVIEDEPDVMDFIQALLQDNGYDVVSAVDGEKGLAAARSHKPDLITLDISMPEKSGVKLYRELKGDPDLGAVPVVMVTGVLSEFKQFISTRKQVPPPEGYVSKPIDKALLLKTVGDLIK
jgi:CheY-like chemotaxis protein